MTDLSNIIQTSFNENGLSDVPGLYDKIPVFEKLAEALVETNKAYNLTAVTDAVGIAGLHFTDSLLALKYLGDTETLLDIGTGAGFPSLPIAIARPDIKVTAIDSTAKKIRFSSDFAAENGLSNFRSLAARAEELINTGLRETFGAVTARAVARLSVLSELCIPYLKPGGTFIALKGSAGKEELAEAEKGIKTLGGEVVAVEERELIMPTERLKRTFIIAKKVRPTPSPYPRTYAKIVKKPL